MKAIEKHRDLVMEALRSHADSLFVVANQHMNTAHKWSRVEAICERNRGLYRQTMADVDALSEVIRELEQERGET